MKIHHKLLLCLSFFTRLPLAPGDAIPLARLVWAFPLVGAAIGLACGAVYGLLHRWGLAPGLAALLMVAFQLWLTRGLHEDGLADMADGFGGGQDKDSRLAIMRDSRIGSFGALALIVTLMLRAYALALLAQPGAVMRVAIAAGAMSRAMIGAGMVGLPNARSDGLAAWAGKPPSGQMVGGIALAGFITLAVTGLAGMKLIMAAIVICGITCLISKRKIGGITGDVYGAIQQLVETGMLIMATTLL